MDSAPEMTHVISSAPSVDSQLLVVTFLILKFLIYSFIHLRSIETEYIYWFTSQMPIWLGHCQANSRSQKPNPGLQSGWQTSNYLIHHLLPPTVHIAAPSKPKRVRKLLTNRKSDPE